MKPVKFTDDYDHPVRKDRRGRATKVLAYKKGWAGEVADSTADAAVEAGKAVIEAPEEPPAPVTDPPAPPPPETGKKPPRQTEHPNVRG